MGRLSREYKEGSIYHVFQRGNNKEFLFESDESKGMLIHNFKEFRRKFDYDILGFVLMNNHYHFIIKLNNDPLDKIMFGINNVYAKYINKSLSRSGHVFESRYKCKIVDSETYLIWLLRYVHRNPIRAKMARSVEDYFWSSHYFYKNANSDTINTSFILSLISNEKAKAVQWYMKYMTLLGNDDDEQKDYKILSDLYEFNFQNQELFNMNESRNNIREDLETIANRIFKDYETKQLMTSGSKQRHLTPLKIEFIKEAKALHYTLNEIGKHLNCAESTICSLLARNKNILL